MIYPDKDESAASIGNHLQEYAYKIPALEIRRTYWLSAARSKSTRSGGFQRQR